MTKIATVETTELPADSILAGLLESLETLEADTSAAIEDDSIVESVASPAHSDEDLLQSVVADVERSAEKHALYAEQNGATITDAVEPGTSAEAVTAGKKEKKAKAPKAAKAPKEPKAPKAPKVPKELRATSVTHKPGDLLKIKLGEKAADYLLFSMADATLSTADLQAKQDAFIARMNDSEAIADKVKEKMSMFLIWIQKGGELNEVLKRAVTVLCTDGELTSGDKGNLQLNLLAKPYSIGTARSQANQMFMAFPELGLTIKEKGRMIPNPDSTLLGMAKAALGL